MPLSFPITIDGVSGTVEPSEYDITTRNGKGSRITATEFDNSFITIRNALNYLYENSSGGLVDGDKGDITVSGFGTVWTIDAGAVTLSKIVDATAANVILGRITTGSGDFEELSAANVRTIINVEDGAEANDVNSVNTKTGTVVLDPDDLDDTSTINKFISATELSKLAGIEDEADVTDSSNVSAAGAAMAGGAFHDGFSDFVANEHIDWTTDQGATNIHIDNIPDLSGTYAIASKGVTNGDSHDHSGGDGASIPDTAFASGATVASAGATDSGKLIKLDAAGHVDASCINDADINLDNITEGSTNKFFTATDETTLADALQKSTATTKGDLLVATASATITRLGVGTNDYVLTADSAQTEGIKWAALPSAGISDLVDDTTPQLGGNLDMNEKSIVCEFGTLTSDHTASGEIITGTAGESVAFGDICYLKSDGKFWKTDSDAEATAKGMIVMAIATISADASGSFLKKGYARDDSWAWTTGDQLFIDATTAGGMTATAPSGSGDIVRLTGYAKGADYVEFDPSKMYLEVA